jgi:Tol biopolymer transport system component
MYAEGKVPIRLIDLETNSEIELCRVYTNKLEGPRRVDPHPVWSFNDNYIVFNAVIGGARQVMLFKFKGKK